MSTTKELSNAIAKQMQTRVENVGEDDNPVEFIIAVDAVDGGLYSTIPEFRRMQGETVWQELESIAWEVRQLLQTNTPKSVRPAGMS